MDRPNKGRIDRLTREAMGKDREARDPETVFWQVAVWGIIIFLAACAIAACGGAGDATDTGPVPTTSNVAVTAGCYSSTYNNEPSSALGCGLLFSSGSPIFDSKLAGEVALQSQFWVGLPTTVYLFNECPGNMNALSLPQHVILLGANISTYAIISTGSDLPIAGILAHEWGHQAQFANGWMNPSAPTVRLTELEADAFSGYYMGLWKGWAGPELSTYFQLLFQIGDYNFNSPGHHGTPEQRRSAGALGMQVAGQAIATGRHYSYADLHGIFSSTIKSTVLETEPANDGAAISHGIDPAYIRRLLKGQGVLEEIIMPPASAEYRATLRPFARLAE